MELGRALNEELPEVFDVFSGAGGLALGFQAAGCHIGLAVDLDARAGESFARNFAILQPESPPLVLVGRDYDLEHFELGSITVTRRPDILIGGPLCQAFSQLGRGKLAS